MLAKRSLASPFSQEVILDKKTWVEIDPRAAKYNYNTFRKLVGSKVKLWSVVKSNAYGHGLFAFSRIMNDLGVDGFCVDSVIEGLALRREGIAKPILVLGPTLPALIKKASEGNVVISVSNFEALRAISDSPDPPAFHLKIDTGMHRQGFYPEDMPKVLKILKNKKARIENYLQGAFTHFASAKDVNYPTYTEMQFHNYEKAVRLLERGGYKNILRHAAATGGTLTNPKYHLDMVRVGMGLYGYAPSTELSVQLPKIKFKPVLSWRSILTEIKSLKPGDYVGYDLAERVTRPTTMGIVPIGYWHGFPRSLSHIGEVLVSGRRARVLGRVSMDLIAVDLTGIKCRIGERATLIGKDKDEYISGLEIAAKSGTTQYEFLTRLNPLIERVIIS